MSRIQLANPAVRRQLKRKKFQYVIQVLEELGQRIKRTSTLKADRARPPPRTPQRTNLTVHLQTQSPTKQTRRSQPQDTAARQEPIRQVRTSTDVERHSPEHNVRQRDRRGPKNGKDHDAKRARTRTSSPTTRDNTRVRRRRSHHGTNRWSRLRDQEPSPRRNPTSRIRTRRDLRRSKWRGHGSRRGDRPKLRLRSL